MNILALDLATKTGWAHSDGTSGVKCYDWAGVPNDQRWHQHFDWLSEVLADKEADAIVYEQAHHRGGAATRIAVGLVTVTELFANCLRLQVKPYHTATIKKHATGKGNAKKHEMYAAAKQRNPDREFIDDNEIDALFLLDLALSDLPAVKE